MASEISCCHAVPLKIPTAETGKMGLDLSRKDAAGSTKGDEDEVDTSLRVFGNHSHPVVTFPPGIHIDTHDIEILSSGLGKINDRDLLMVFYVTIRHHGVTTQRVMLTVTECCEKILDGETDCDFMDLYGSHAESVAPGATKNLTLYYPNLYGYNRNGWCLVNVLHHSPGKRDLTSLRHRINFDTTVGDPVPGPLRGLYNPHKVTRCDTPDLDPFDNCNPVICSIKYSGFRNYYNRKWKRCQKVPVCKATEMKELPDIVYVPTINICRNVANAVTEEDTSQILQGITESNSVEDQVVNIRCHHGEIDPRTGLCICDYGWKSEPFDPDLYNPHSIYSMCNIRCFPASKTRTAPAILYPLIGIVLALWLASCIVCFESWGCYSILKRRFSASSSNHCSMYCTVQEEEEIEEEIENTRYNEFSEMDNPGEETVCSLCLQQCPRTIDGDHTSKSGDNKSLWDIAR